MVGTGTGEVNKFAATWEYQLLQVAPVSQVELYEYVHRPSAPALRAYCIWLILLAKEFM
jgi:hypothetical protein